jgi:uncharacterized protein DUF3489
MYIARHSPNQNTFPRFPLPTNGYPAHSVRGFLFGTVGKKLGLEVVSTKADDGERTYSVKG